ncbi:hypothetical protein M9458_009034, partial [Cirrhinus mrigala]
HGNRHTRHFRSAVPVTSRFFYEYTFHFRTLAAASGWNEISLLGAYQQGLIPDICAALVIYDDNIRLESFLQCATRVSQQLAACQPPVTAPQSASVAASSPVPEPIQVDSTRLDEILIYSRKMAEHCQHVQQVFLKLRQHQLYLQLEKCEFHKPSVQFLGYNISAEGVLMDQGKVDPIQKWPQSNSIKELQRFLGFTNFYRRFIKGYSSITAPLTSLLRGKPKHLTWNPAAHEALQHLKHLFSTVPFLHHPDPELPFTVEVDTSTTGVGAVLSQAVGESAILHPCAFYSRKLSPVEQNCDVGNRELLAIKLALEEWRHWLEGAIHPFTIINDHKNLQYLRDAKRLNPRQNIPADALSHQSSPDQPTDPEPIIPPKLIVCPIIWNMDQDIQQATLQEPAPPECPEGKIYVPRSQCQHLLGTAHQSPGSGHPGSKRTLSLLQTRYWWPSMRRDTIRYVQSCSVCAMSNSPRMLPTGKLVPLPIPERPWSHLGVDFVTDLPSSEGNTCVLVIVDRFSKTCKFVPLKGLPTAMETAEHLFHQVFRHFGIPEEIVSDRGPQFISHVWKSFFKLLGVSVNLSSGYHPDREKDPGARTVPPGILSRGPTQLEQVPPVGRVRTELPPPRFHRLNTISVRTRIPASAVPLDGGALQCSS